MNKVDTSTKNENQKKNTRYALILLVFAIIAAVLSSLPIVQNKLKALFYKDSRLVLAKVSAFYGHDQAEYLILKIKDSMGIQIEIYEVTGKKNTEENTAQSQQIFKQKFELAQDSDAYLTLNKSTTNLALSDVDKDGQLDILAPSVDRNGNLRLNTFRFNTELNSFEPLVELNN
ncbi:MAG: hypothetical protein AABY53_03335 [Bdellovibrionota bacterium]